MRRQPIYEIDRMDPVDQAASLRLDAAVLDAYPAGYRHLAYLLSTVAGGSGRSAKPTQPLAAAQCRLASDVHGAPACAPAVREQRAAQFIVMITKTFLLT